MERFVLKTGILNFLPSATHLVVGEESVKFVMMILHRPEERFTKVFKFLLYFWYLCLQIGFAVAIIRIYNSHRSPLDRFKLF